MTEQAAIGHVQSQCQGWIAIEKRRERKKGSAEGEEKKLLTQKKLELEEGGRWREGGGRFMGEVYYYTALPRGGKGRAVGRKRQNIPFPLPLLLPIQKPHRGWRALSQEGGGMGGGGWGGVAQKRCLELRWNKQRVRMKPGFQEM